MPPATKDRKGLSPPQREAARLEALENLRPSELAERCGVSVTTISTWRRLDAYKEHVDELAGKLEERAVIQAGKILAEATKGLLLGARRMVRQLEQDPDLDPIPTTRALHDIYRTTSGQVGVTERTRQELTAHVSIDDLISERLGELSDDELQAIADAEVD